MGSVRKDKRRINLDRVELKFLKHKEKHGRVLTKFQQELDRLEARIEKHNKVRDSLCRQGPRRTNERHDPNQRWRRHVVRSPPSSSVADSGSRMSSSSSSSSSSCTTLISSSFESSVADSLGSDCDSACSKLQKQCDSNHDDDDDEVDDDLNKPNEQVASVVDVVVVEEEEEEEEETTPTLVERRRRVARQYEEKLRSLLKNVKAKLADDAQKAKGEKTRD